MVSGSFGCDHANGRLPTYPDLSPPGFLSGPFFRTLFAWIPVSTGMTENGVLKIGFSNLIWKEGGLTVKKTQKAKTVTLRPGEVQCTGWPGRPCTTVLQYGAGFVSPKLLEGGQILSGEQLAKQVKCPACSQVCNRYLPGVYRLITVAKAVQTMEERQAEKNLDAERLRWQQEGRRLITEQRRLDLIRKWNGVGTASLQETDAGRMLEKLKKRLPAAVSVNA